MSIEENVSIREKSIFDEGRAFVPKIEKKHKLHQTIKIFW